MTATDRALLRHRAFDSHRPSVFRLATCWATVDPTQPVGQRMEHHGTYAEAVTYAHSIAHTRAERAIVDGAS